MAASGTIPSHPYRIFVSGLAKTAVHRYDGGIVEEDDLGYFFHDRGCKVGDVRLMVDPSTNRCRGFGFVDFADEASFEKALTYAGERDPENIHLDATSGGRLKVEAAKPAEADARERQRELARVRDQTESMERALRLREARVRELERELRASRERQQQLDAQKAVEAHMVEERARQDAILKAEETLKAVEEVLNAALRGEQDRTRALEAIVGGVDTEQTRRHAEEHEEEPAGQQVVAPRHVSGPEAENTAEVSDVSGPQPELRIRNTFIEYCVPREAEPLVRTQTAPANYPGTDGSATPADASTATGSSAASRGLLSLTPAPSPPAPWALKRDSSTILRSILEDKMEAESCALPRGMSADRISPDANRGSAFSTAPGAPHVIGEFSRPGRTSWADLSMSQADGGSVDGAGDDNDEPVEDRTSGKRDVRIRNLPLLSADELEVQLREELARLWRAARGRPPPAIESVRVAEHVREAEASYAARAAGTEAIITFQRGQDAAWLVDDRQPANWSSAETLSLRGRVLHAEWPPAPPPADWRRLRYKADTDASSQVSYATDGTKRSFSSAVARTAGGASSGGRSGENPAQNRTVILAGISTSLPSHTVRSEVLDLLRRLWQRDGYRFDVEAQLHRGAEGISVRGPRRPGDENDGSCVLRLRSYADAKWLVEQAKGLSIEGRPLRAYWARPRGHGSGALGSGAGAAGGGAVG